MHGDEREREREREEKKYIEREAGKGGHEDIGNTQLISLHYT